MKNFQAAVVFGLFASAWAACHYGRTWEFGPHGLPMSVLSSDGMTYRDGSPIDVYSAAMIRNGLEETFWAVWLAFMGCMGILLAIPSRVLKSKFQKLWKSGGR